MPGKRGRLAEPARKSRRLPGPGTLPASGPAFGGRVGALPGREKHRYRIPFLTGLCRLSLDAPPGGRYACLDKIAGRAAAGAFPGTAGRPGGFPAGRGKGPGENKSLLTAAGRKKRAAAGGDPSRRLFLWRKTLPPGKRRQAGGTKKRTDPDSCFRPSRGEPKTDDTEANANENRCG